MDKHKINISHYLGTAWGVLNEDFAKFLLLGLIYMAISILSSGTIIGTVVVMGPINVGMFLIMLQKLRGEKLDFGELGQGFSFFIAAVLAHLIILVMVSVGLFLLIIPGFIVFVFYMFTPLYIADKDMDFWQAMEASRLLVKKHWFDLTVFALILLGILLAGALLLGVGLIFSIPLVFLCIAVAYLELA